MCIRDRPWIRPIVRGKAHANTEFGAKLHISMVDGYAKIERLSFDAFNEATDFFAAVEGYRKEHGFYPARVLADKIYRNREIMVWCKGRNIQMTGPVLGRPPKNPVSYTHLQQINDRSYSAEMQALGIKSIIKYGLAFSGKSARIAAEKQTIA